MATLARPRKVHRPVAVLVRIEEFQREALEELAAESQHTLSDELPLAIGNHIRRSIDDNFPLDHEAPRLR